MNRILLICTAGLLLAVNSFSQQFEAPALTDSDFEKTSVFVGGDFALQYQLLDHNADSALIPLGTGFNLPTANFSLGADLAPGIRVFVETYLSSRHHNEAWVKGGYLLIDQLPFLNTDAADRIMDFITLRVGVMELNYGDAHFRRTDNGRATSNPFVGNYIMDAFTTAPSFEILMRSNGWIAMVAATTGSLRPDLVTYSGGNYVSYDAHKEIGFYWKAGFDKNPGENIRTRLTVSGYHIPESNHNSTLYNGDRAGSRYYLVMKRITDNASDVSITSGHNTGRWSPGTANKTNSLMVNTFTKYKGIELFASYEIASGNYSSGNEFNFKQYAIEGLYRFGGMEQFYAGARYNKVKGDTNTALNNSSSVNRLQLAAGWNILESTMLKIEYVNQQYTGFISNYGEEAGFKGVMIEAAISF